SPTRMHNRQTRSIWRYIAMCYPVTCPVCGKTGWEGCGQHVDDVMRDVPVAERCSCADQSVAGR
ncbi:hypothetical protein, partial [Rhodococcus sp. CX]|uniref:hypothetical protein n=1 Tax=Rhodococcus sp. CX TaxID=2789880 RepID=UPI001E516695